MRVNHHYYYSKILRIIPIIIATINATIIIISTHLKNAYHRPNEADMKVAISLQLVKNAKENMVSIFVFNL